MNPFPEGNAIVYCEGAFETLNGKTAHGLIRRSERYHIVGVVDSTLTGEDAGQMLDGRPNGIPIYSDVNTALNHASTQSNPVTHFIFGIAPDGGRLSEGARNDIKTAIKSGLNIVAGLHDYLTEDEELVHLARIYNVQLHDVRKTPHRKHLHFFSGKIESVNALKIALLGTDSAIGKRTSAWLVRDALNAAGIRTELVGTGQTAWLQGARYSLVLDSLINDFVAGEIEHAVWSAWNDLHPEVIIIEGQGSLMNPAYPGGFEILAAGRPDVVLLQHAPARKEYDGFPGYPLHPLKKQIEAIEMISGKPVVAITINHAHLNLAEISQICEHINQTHKIPAFDLFLDGVAGLVATLQQYLKI